MASTISLVPPLVMDKEKVLEVTKVWVLLRILFFLKENLGGKLILIAMQKLSFLKKMIKLKKIVRF